MQSDQLEAPQRPRLLTGLRKKGFVIVREQRGDEGTAYRISNNLSG